MAVTIFQKKEMAVTLAKNSQWLNTMFRLQLLRPNFQAATALGLRARRLKLQVWNSGR